MQIIFKESFTLEEKQKYESTILECIDFFIKNSVAKFDSNYHLALQEINTLMSKSLNLTSDEHIYLDAIESMAKHKKSLIFHFDNILRKNLDFYLSPENIESSFIFDKNYKSLNIIDSQTISYDIDIKPIEELIWENVFEYSNNISYKLHAILQNEKNPFDYKILAHAFVSAIKRLNKYTEVEKMILLSFQPTLLSFIIPLYKEIFDRLNNIKIENINIVLENKSGYKTFIHSNSLSTFDLKISDLTIEKKLMNESNIDNEPNQSNQLTYNNISEQTILNNQSKISEHVNSYHESTINFPYPTINRSNYSNIDYVNLSLRDKDMKNYKDFFMHLITLTHELEVTRESMDNNESVSLQQLLSKKEQRILNNLNTLVQEYLSNKNSSYLLLSEDFYNEIISFKTYLININYSIKEKINLKFQDLIQNDDDSFNLVTDSILPTFPLINEANNNITVFDQFNLNILATIIHLYSKNNNYPIFLKHNIDRLQLSFLYESLKHPLFYIQKEHKIIKIMNSLFSLNSLFSFAYQEKISTKIKKYLEKKSPTEKDLDYLLQKIENTNSDYKNYEFKIIEKFLKNQQADFLLQKTYEITSKFLINYLDKSNNLVYKFLLGRIWGYFFTQTYKEKLNQEPTFFKNPGLDSKIFLNQCTLFFDMLAWLFNFNHHTEFNNTNLEKINLYKIKLLESWHIVSQQLSIPNDIIDIITDTLNTRVESIDKLDPDSTKMLLIKIHSTEKNLMLTLDKKIPNLSEMKKKIIKALHDSKEDNIDLLSYLELHTWFELTDTQNNILKLHLIYVDNINYIYLFNSPNNNKTYKFDLHRIWNFYKNNTLSKLDVKFVPEEFSMLINKAILQTSVNKGFF